MNISRQIVEIGLWLLERDLVTGTEGNISARCPDRTSFLITPSGRDYRLITDRDLVLVHLGSGEAEGRWPPSTEWRLHAAIYRAREDVNAVIHHHAPFVSAVAVARKTIPVLLDEAADIGPILTAPYAPSGSRELADAAAGLLAQGGHVLLLANHGAVAVGRTLPEAFHRANEVERVAKIYLGAELLGGAYPLDETALARMRGFVSTYRASAVEDPALPLSVPRIGGHVGLLDLVTFGFRAGVTLASLFYALILQKLHR